MTELDLGVFTPEFLARYDRPGPRYTSYPTAPQFSDGFGEPEYRAALARAAEAAGEPLSMYVHLPFCEHRCTYCGCNVVISPNRGPEERYLDTMERELDLLAEALGPRRSLNQLHWGGGTPTYLTPGQCERLFKAVTSRFPLTPDAEVAIEVDPCVTTREHLESLARLGFNRISLGLQDLDPRVQAAVERIQPMELTRGIVEGARELGFGSVNIDLIYGLPYQTETTFRDTVQRVVAELAPDRVACFSYAHVPWIKPHQRKLEGLPLPQGYEKFRIFLAATEEFLRAGYRFIGFDHFAKPDDPLSRALETGGIHRNFMGYTVMPATDQVGVGVTAIGDVGGAYAANLKNLARYTRAVQEGHLPVERGIVRSPEDELRGAVIRRIICTLGIEWRWVQERFGVDPREHFADALAQLEPLAADGLVELHQGGLQVTPTGRFFLRNICMPFDAYLRRPSERPVYSRTV